MTSSPPPLKPATTCCAARWAGVHYIPVSTPPGINTLDFGLSETDRRRLFDAGYNATSAALANLEPLKRVKMAGDELQRQLQAELGPAQFFTPVLHALAKDIEASTKAKGVRKHIMLPTGREPPTRIVTYNYGMDRSTDIDLELPETAGCSGHAWSARAPILADLVEVGKDPAPWGMTKQQHDKVPRSQMSMLSVPVQSGPGLAPGENQPPAPVGTLSVDSTTPLNETGWLEMTSGEPIAHPKTVAIMMNWAYIVRRLLPEVGALSW